MAVLKDNKKGYTLIELLVVAALLSVLLSIAVPRFSLLHSIREKQEIKYLQRDLLYARNTAITQKKPITVELSIINNSYKIKQKNEVLKEVNLDNGVVLTGCSKSSIGFSTSGTSGEAQTITFHTTGGDYYVLTIPVATLNIKLEKVN